MLIWAAVIWSIYSNFLVFHSNFSESENYHKAYYASISALERWELVTKQRSPWYIWSGWFILGIWTWSDPDNTNWWSDKNLEWFSYFWDNPESTSVFWSVNSSTTRIPAEWNWDVERMLSYNSNNSDDSNNYNMMDYEYAQVFLLYADKSENNPYKKTSCTGTDCSHIGSTTITWEIRLPKQLIKSGDFKPLNTGASLIWKNNELPKDDAVIDWQIRWKLTDNTQFTVYSTQKTDINDASEIIYNNDTIFRESDINKTLKFTFWNVWNPIFNSQHGRSNPVTIISQKEGDIRDYWNFETLFGNSKEKQIRFSLLNLLKDQSQNSKVYPFLEYYIDFWKKVADKYYTIEGEWNFADFQVNTTIQKPTVKESVLSDFTSIF